MPGGRGAHAQQLAAGGLHAALAGHALREGDHLLAHARLVQDARLRGRPRSAPAPCPAHPTSALRCHGGGAYEKRGARAGRATGGPFHRPARRSNPWDQQQNLASPQQQRSDSRCSGTSTTTACCRAAACHARRGARSGGRDGSGARQGVRERPGAAVRHREAQVQRAAERLGNMDVRVADRVSNDRVRLTAGAAPGQASPDAAAAGR